MANADVTLLDKVIKEYMSSQDLVKQFKAKEYEVMIPKKFGGNAPEWMGSTPIPMKWIEEGKRPYAPKYGIKDYPDMGYKPQTFKIHNAAGATTSEGTLAREIMRKVIYRASTDTSVGLEVCFLKGFDNFEAIWDIPEELEWQYGLPLDGGISKIQSMQYWSYKMGLQKGGAAVMITDAARVVNRIEQIQKDMSRRITEAMTTHIDGNILTALWGGAGGGTAGVVKDIGTNDKWDHSGSSQPDLIRDVNQAHKTWLGTTDLPDSVLKSVPIDLTLPRTARPFLTSIPGISGSVDVTRSQEVATFLKNQNINVVYTNHATFLNDGLMSVKAEDIAAHGIFTGSQIPLVEQERVVGRGTAMYIYKIYNTKVAPTTLGGTTNVNIGKITDIYAD
jgi:hypothetical protein